MNQYSRHFSELFPLEAPKVHSKLGADKKVTFMPIIYHNRKKAVIKGLCKNSHLIIRCTYFRNYIGQNSFKPSSHIHKE